MVKREEKELVHYDRNVVKNQLKQVKENIAKGRYNYALSFILQHELRNEFDIDVKKLAINVAKVLDPYLRDIDLVEVLTEKISLYEKKQRIQDYFDNNVRTTLIPRDIEIAKKIWNILGKSFSDMYPEIFIKKKYKILQEQEKHEFLKFKAEYKLLKQILSKVPSENLENKVNQYYDRDEFLDRISLVINNIDFSKKINDLFYQIYPSIKKNQKKIKIPGNKSFVKKNLNTLDSLEDTVIFYSNKIKIKELKKFLFNAPEKGWSTHQLAEELQKKYNIETDLDEIFKTQIRRLFKKLGLIINYNCIGRNYFLSEFQKQKDNEILYIQKYNQVIELYNNSETKDYNEIRKISKIVSLDLDLVQGWIRKYNKNSEYIPMKYHAQLSISQKREISDYISHEINSKNLTANEITQFIFEKYGINYSLDQTYFLITQLNYFLKNIRSPNGQLKFYVRSRKK